MNRAMLLNWFDLEDQDLATFEDWHNREHMIERLDVPGFTLARRYRSRDPEPTPGQAFLVAYDVTELDVLRSPEYLRRLDNPTPKTAIAVPLLKKLTRTAFDLVEDRRRGIPRHLATLRLSSEGRGLSDSERKTLRGELNAVYEESAFVTGVRLGRPDAKITHTKDQTQEGRATQTLARESYPWIVIVETTQEQEAAKAIDRITSLLARDAPGLELASAAETFSLVMSMV